jgi:hypothetical protein
MRNSCRLTARCCKSWRNEGAIFLSREAVDLIHAASIEAFGGSLGLRDETALESALAQPFHEHIYRNADVFAMAAAYAYHIAKTNRTWTATRAPRF